MRWKRSVYADARIPTASTADIAFLLLVFFLSTTIFKMENGLPVTLPRAEAGVPVPRRNASHIYLDARGNLSVDDYLIPVSGLGPILARHLRENPALIVGLTVDQDVPYARVEAVMEELKRAGTLNVSFTVVRPQPVR